MKFGVNLHYDQIIHHQFSYRNGSFGFNGQETGSDWVDFLLGAPSNYSQGSQLDLITRSHYLGLYAQDSWRIAPNLTLNYGLRWDITQPWYEQRNELETIIPGEQSVVFPGAPRGWVVPGDPGVPSCAPYLCEGAATCSVAACAGDSECGASAYCDATGHCVDAACANMVCPEGQKCVGGQCVGPCDGVVCPHGQV